MKLKFSMKTLILLLITNLFVTSCSDDDPQDGCYQDDNRKIVATIENVIGTIIESESCDFVIDPEENLANNPVGLLSPCNLAEEFQLDGREVMFSGYIYESFENENICADFFEITSIRLNNP